MRRSRFCLVLPLALPGIVTGIALRSAIGMGDIPFSFWTIVIGHATFCVVVVYNNVLARLRRFGSSLDGSLHGSGREWLPDFSLYPLAPPVDRFAGRRDAGLCPVI